VAGRFPLFTDENVPGSIVKGLIRLGWDVERAVDTFPLGTDDDLLFEHAARSGRLFVSSDEPARSIATRWLREGRPFVGMICWIQKHQYRMTEGDFIRAFECFAIEEEPFAYRIRHIKPD
jgi:hypothetical protein